MGQSSGHHVLSDSEKVQIITNTVNQFNVDDKMLRKLMDLLLVEMENGLCHEDTSKATVKMLPSYVRALPNGSEKGNFLALDLGGTNFRVLLIKLHGDNKSDMKSKIYQISQEIMHGSGTQLFDHIADCLAQFIHEAHLEKENLDLGFTFSFPLLLSGLTSGRLISWTKGFKCSGVEGEDVVQLLQQAAHRKKEITVDVVAILNDTVGTLMSLAYTDPMCQIGVIVGTGSNACYLEKMSKCPKLKDLNQTDKDEMVINTEWGGFGDNGVLNFIQNEFDRIVDTQSINPGKQIFEKFISGMYMGELLRLVLRHLTDKGAVFVGKYVGALAIRNTITTKHISDVEIDATENESTYPRTHEWLANIHILNVDRTDCDIIHKVCAAISTRAANLCAAGIAVLLNRVHKPHVTVGIDGSVYRFHPWYKKLLETRISALIDKNLHFKLKLSEDGSGRGAALVAAVAHRVKDKKKI